MGVQAPQGLLAIHTNMPAVVPADVQKALDTGSGPPPGLSADERKAYEQLGSNLQAGRLCTDHGLAAADALTASLNTPVFLAAWLLDHNDADAPAGGGGQRWPAAGRSSSTGELTRDEISTTSRSTG